MFEFLFRVLTFIGFAFILLFCFALFYSLVSALFQISKEDKKE